MDETVTHYITSHPSDEAVHVDGNALTLNVQDDGGGRVAVMHSQTFSTSLCRQVSVGDQVAEGQWGEELIDPEGRLAALMAHITAQQSRGQPQMHHKIHAVRGDVDSSIILDSSMRLFHGPPMEDSPMVESDGPVLELGPGASPAQHKHHSKKSLPHKKRISRKLKKNNGNSTPQQQELVVISCSDVESRMGLAAAGAEQEILPDTFAPHHAHHITHEVRPIYICQLCGEFYGEEQLKFYQHLKQHYEPHIIIENPVPDLGIDKMSNTCIVDNVTTIPDSIVELSLENTIPKTMYQTIDKHVLYTTSDKTYTYPSNKVQYSMASMDKDPPSVVQEVEKTDLYDSLDKLDLYSCGKCNKSFRKQKQCEAHIKEVHSNMKLEDMGEFSEPEDLMEGIHVAVDEPHESHVSHDSHVSHESHVPHESHEAHESHAQQYEHTLLPHLTVENGHAHQENVRHWYGRGPSTAAPGGAGSPAPQCCAPPHDTQHLKLLKANTQYEILRRILETDVTTNNQNFADNIIPDNGENIIPDNADNMMSDNADTSDLPNDNPPPEVSVATDVKPDVDKKKSKHFECPECPRVFQHRNSLLYHSLSHSGKQHICRECGKGFYTVAALKIHKRVHNGDRPYKCDVCGRDFRQWSDVNYHKISIHSDQKLYKCEFCGKEFARKYSLNVHRRIHTGERNYKCDYCTKTFRASSYRLSHMRTHTGDKPHKCPQCDKSFRVAGDLRRHMLIHDKVRNRLTDQKVKPKDKDDKKPIDKTDDKPDIKIEPKIKKIALASTTKGPTIIKSTEKKTKPNKKNHSPKKGAPNVTIDQLDESYTNNVEVFDTRQDGHYGKLVSAKEEYSDCNYKEELDNPFAKQVIEYKEEQTHERELAILRPMFRNNMLCDQTVAEADHTVFRQENTDGKMQVYTHIEKGNIIVPNTQMSLGHLEREVRTDMHETNENGFIERLTALYNVPPV
uniref:C2H2-type domain-containing protein n=1 Tax=Heliothis virescens TaxID=7102 RepID=A0A2A4K0L4_HELVI